MAAIASRSLAGVILGVRPPFRPRARGGEPGTGPFRDEVALKFGKRCEDPIWGAPGVAEADQTEARGFGDVGRIRQQEHRCAVRVEHPRCELATGRASSSPTASGQGLDAVDRSPRLRLRNRMALTNAQKQARWRDKRNEEARALKGKPKEIAERILRELGVKEAARVVRALDKRLRNIKPDCPRCNGTGIDSGVART